MQSAERVRGAASPPGSRRKLRVHGQLQQGRTYLALHWSASVVFAAALLVSSARVVAAVAMSCPHLVRNTCLSRRRSPAGSGLCCSGSSCLWCSDQVCASSASSSRLMAAHSDVLSLCAPSSHLPDPAEHEPRPHLLDRRAPTGLPRKRTAPFGGRTRRPNSQPTNKQADSRGAAAATPRSAVPAAGPSDESSVS